MKAKIIIYILILFNLISVFLIRQSVLSALSSPKVPAIGPRFDKTLEDFYSQSSFFFTGPLSNLYIIVISFIIITVIVDMIFFKRKIVWCCISLALSFYIIVWECFVIPLV